MTQLCYLKTNAGQMYVREALIMSPDGKEFRYTGRGGLLTFNSATGTTFTELMANPWLTENDIEHVKAIARALTDTKQLIAHPEKFK